MRGAATVAADRRGALIDLQRGGDLGILVRHGRRWNARVLAPGDVSSVQLEDEDLICLRLADFAWPRARIRIPDAEARAKWLARLNALTSPDSSRHHPDLRHA